MASLEAQITYALLGGAIPALLWLFFWLREDLHPEPHRLLIRAFFAGAVAIPFALLGEALTYCGGVALFGDVAGAGNHVCLTIASPLAALPYLFSPLTVVAFAGLEELTKYKVARSFVLKGADFDEPVDAMIYLITVALGFAAFENFFFLITAFGRSLTEGLVVSNLRFLGATLLHLISSGIVGYSIALSFYAPNRKWHVVFGLTLATILHAVFNFVILAEGTVSGGVANLFVLLLTGILLIFAFDQAKKIKQIKTTFIANNGSKAIDWYGPYERS